MSAFLSKEVEQAVWGALGVRFSGLVGVGGRADLNLLWKACEGPSDAMPLFLVFQLSIEQAQTVAEQVEMKAKVVQSEVKAVTARHKKALEERECELLWKVMGRVHPPTPPPVLASSASQHLFCEPHVRSWAPALNLDDLVVVQSSIGRKIQGSLEPCGCSPGSKITRSLFISGRVPRLEGVPSFLWHTRSEGS